jgi:hypothetical protein
MKQGTFFSSPGRLLIVGGLLIILVLPLVVCVVLQRQVTRQQKAVGYPPAIYQGVYLRGLQGVSSLAKLTTFETDAGKKAAIVMWFQSWADSTGKNFNPAFMTAVRNRGSIPLITWEPRNTALGPDQPRFALQNILNGTYDGYISTFAQNAKAWGHPFFLRFAHEMNDRWAPWSEQVNGNKAGQYVLVWRHIHNIFAAKGVTNVTWVWCPDAHGDISTLQELYPGDNYIDWLCMDGYNAGTHLWRSFATTISQTYQNLRTITSKPQMIAETGSSEQGGSKADWIIDAYTRQLPANFPDIKAIIWFNVDQRRESVGIDWRIESSPAAQHAFATALRSPVYATNHYSSLNTSPIPSCSY